VPYCRSAMAASYAAACCCCVAGWMNRLRIAMIQQRVRVRVSKAAQRGDMQ
jgi:hypothetical protein